METYCDLLIEDWNVDFNYDGRAVPVLGVVERSKGITHVHRGCYAIYGKA